MFKYKIEEWDRELGNDTFFVAFVRLPAWFGFRWSELGRVDTKEAAKELCRKHQKPKSGPWLYTAESIMSDGGL